MEDLNINKGGEGGALTLGHNVISEYEMFLGD
jgi:hypothetical protein